MRLRKIEVNEGGGWRERGGGAGGGEIHFCLISSPLNVVVLKDQGAVPNFQDPLFNDDVCFGTACYKCCLQYCPLIAPCIDATTGF